MRPLGIDSYRCQGSAKAGPHGRPAGPCQAWPLPRRQRAHAA